MKSLVSCGVALFAAGGLLAPSAPAFAEPAADAFDATPAALPHFSFSGPQRFAGADRYQTAVAVSRNFPGHVKTLLIATGTNYPDALVAGPAAAHLGAPILLADAAGLSPETVSEVTRLAPQQVLIVGGESAVPEQAVTQVREAVAGVKVRRASGANRYETAAEVTQLAFPNAPVPAVIATGDNYPDALAASAAAASFGGALIITPRAALHPRSAAELQRLQAGYSGVVGGGFSAQTLSQIAAATGHQPAVLAGADRYETAAAVAKNYWPQGASTVAVARGDNYPDALVGTPVAGSLRAPLLLTRPNCVPFQYQDFTGAKTQLLLGTPALDLTSPACPARPRARYIEAPYYSQVDSVRPPAWNGCETASLLMAMQAKGYYQNIDLATLLAWIPKHRNDPRVAFGGSPYAAGGPVHHSIDPGPMAAFARSIGVPARDITGESPDQIANHILDGNPVVWWTTVHAQNPAAPSPWMTDNGVIYRSVNMHVVLLNGYDADRRVFTVTDPYNWGPHRPAPYRYGLTWDRMNQLSASQERRAVVIE